MFLTAKSIRDLIENGMPPLIDIPDGNDTQMEEFGNDIRFIEGSGFDLRLHRVQIQANQSEIPFFGKDERMIPEGVDVPFFDEEKRIWMLHQFHAYKFQSLETINMPHYLVGLVFARTSIFRGDSGLFVGSISPGFSGKITAEFCQVSAFHSAKVQQGFKFATVRFAVFADDEDVQWAEYQVKREAVDAYKGIWSGDKITTGGKIERGF